MNAFDTNILIYAFDDAEPAKQRKAETLLDRLILSADTILLWQVGCEFLGCLRRWQTKGRISALDVENHFTEILLSFPLSVPHREVLLHSLLLTSRYCLSHWDSLVIAACSDAEVDTLYSEDMQHDQVYDGVRVINPFV